MAVFVGKGTILQLDIGGTYTAIANVVSIGGPSMAVGTVDTTHLSSAGKEFLPTMPDYGEVTATIEYDPDNATHSALTALIAAPAVKGWKILFSDDGDTIYSFSGCLTSFSISGIEMENVVTAEVGIKISGAVTIS